MTDEDDYMSDAFVSSYLKADVRPGLIFNRDKKRKIHLDQKKQEVDVRTKNLCLSKAALEKERLSQGLEQPIGPDNKGFTMLQKMGFTPGNSLGTNMKGIAQPISITVKNDRTGLGRAQALKDIEARKQQIRDKRLSSVTSIDEYRLLLSQRYKHKDIELDLKRSKQACYRLDLNNGIEEPIEDWFWPKKCLPQREEEESDDEDSVVAGATVEYQPSDELEMLTMYLRQTYLYCIWCGNQFEDQSDLTNACPGQTRNDH